MLRWLILMGSFALWLGCMTVVYLQCKPVKLEETEEASRVALNRMFSVNAADRRAWTIYVDPAELETALGNFAGPKKAAPTPKGPRSKHEWNGLDEIGLLKAGQMETLVKNRRGYDSIDEETSMQFDLPGTEFYVHYTGTAHLTYDSGIESSSMAMKLGIQKFDLDALVAGHREGGDFIATTTIAQNGQTLYSGQSRVTIGGNSALNAELAPFQFNPDMRPGMEWTITSLSVDLGKVGEAQAVAPLRVSCIGNSTIMMNGNAQRAWVVRSENGEALAWYSPDGVVLKQTFRLAGMINIMLVRDEKRK